MSDALKRLRAYRGSDAATMLLIEQVAEEIERLNRIIAERDSETRAPRRRKYCPHCRAAVSTKAPVNCPDCGKPLVIVTPEPVEGST